jgi:hypothetical protein
MTENAFEDGAAHLLAHMLTQVAIRLDRIIGLLSRKKVIHSFVHESGQIVAIRDDGMWFIFNNRTQEWEIGAGVPSKPIPQD